MEKQPWYFPKKMNRHNFPDVYNTIETRDHVYNSRLSLHTEETGIRCYEHDNKTRLSEPVWKGKKAKRWCQKRGFMIPSAYLKWIRGQPRQ